MRVGRSVSGRARGRARWSVGGEGTHLDGVRAGLVDANVLVLVERLDLGLAKLVGGVLDVRRVNLQLWVLVHRGSHVDRVLNWCWLTRSVGKWIW